MLCCHLVSVTDVTEKTGPDVLIWSRIHMQNVHCTQYTSVSQGLSEHESLTRPYTAAISTLDISHGKSSWSWVHGHGTQQEHGAATTEVIKRLSHHFLVYNFQMRPNFKSVLCPTFVAFHRPISLFRVLWGCKQAPLPASHLVLHLPLWAMSQHQEESWCGQYKQGCLHPAKCKYSSLFITWGTSLVAIRENENPQSATFLLPNTAACLWGHFSHFKVPISPRDNDAMVGWGPSPSSASACQPTLSCPITIQVSKHGVKPYTCVLLQPLPQL